MIWSGWFADNLLFVTKGKKQNKTQQIPIFDSDKTVIAKCAILTSPPP